MNTYPKLGNFLRTARERSGLFQSDLATKLGTTQQTVSRWEDGLVRPRYNDIGKIAEILSVCPIDLLVLGKYNIYTHKMCESAETQKGKTTK